MMLNRFFFNCVRNVVPIDLGVLISFNAAIFGGEK